MENTIKNAINYIEEFFQNEYSGHDFYHSMRVYKLAKTIAEKESADIGIVSLASLLHDVDDRKLSPDTHEKKENAVTFLKGEKVPDSVITRICTIIEEVSFAGQDSRIPNTIEGKCVQDADRLDALGAIGIARTFAYGGNHNRDIYNPHIPPKLDMTEDEYAKHVSTSINHFYEKLFVLKGLMNTEYAKKIAEKRENYMKAFIEEFMLEWDGQDDRIDAD